MKKKLKTITSIILILALCLPLAGCKPKELESEWTYNKETADVLLNIFSGIARIPRQTASCKEISDYMLMAFEALDFYTEQDAYGNLVVTVPATDGLEKRPLTIIQSNMDMVCAPQPSEGTAVSILDEAGNIAEDPGDPVINYVYNPLTDGISTVYNDGMLKGLDTALGAKSGMAMAMLLKYLSEDNPHGPLRIILTVDAHDSFAGALALDEKYLEDAKYLINLNGGSSSSIYTSSPCEETWIVQRDAVGEAEPSKDCCAALRACNLVGGSAADNIRLGRLNAGLVLIELLDELRTQKIDFQLSSLYGGLGTDSIIRDATAVLVFDKNDFDKIWAVVSKKANEYKSEYEQIETAFDLTLTETNMIDKVMTADALNDALDYGLKCRYGAISDSLISNLGSILISPGRIAFRSLYIGTNQEELDAMTTEAQSLADSFKYEAQLNRRAENWTGKGGGRLSKIISSHYKSLDGGVLNEASASTGLEASVFAVKKPDLDIVSIGPDVWDSGTIEEFCNVESAVKILNLLQGILPEIK